MMQAFERYFNLLGKIVLLIISIFATAFLLLIGLKFLMQGLDYIPWFTYGYMCVMLLIPPVFFSTVFIIFWKRTSSYPGKVIRIISYAIFLFFILGWSTVLVTDLVVFFKNNFGDIVKYNGYNLLYLSATIFMIFITGIIQALGMPKEIDWMEKHRMGSE